MDGVESLAYSSDENVLFSGSRDKSMKKWDMNTKTVMKVKAILLIQVFHNSMQIGKLFFLHLGEKC